MEQHFTELNYNAHFVGCRKLKGGLHDFRGSYSDCRCAKSKLTQVFLHLWDHFVPQNPQRVKSHKSNRVFPSPLAFLLRKLTQYSTPPSPRLSQLNLKQIALKRKLLIEISLNQLTALKLNRIFRTPV
jgi:hypothetical protein